MTRAFALFATLKSVVGRKSFNRTFIGSASVIACTSLLTVGSAHAATSTNCAAPGTVAVGFLTVSNIICSGDAAGRVDVLIEVSEVGINYLFSGDLTPAPSVLGFNDGNISYDIAINPLAKLEFKEVTLSATGLFSNYTATKEIRWSGGSGVLVTGVPAVGPAEPVFSFAPFPNVMALSIKDIWLGATKLDTITDINNGFRLQPAKGEGDPVPGPLPIAGAAACFGLSRQLRARIKRSRITA